MTDDQPETFILAGRDTQTGERHETEMSVEQTLDAVAALRRGEPAVLSYAVPEEQVLIDEDGQITHRESAIPRPPDPREDRS